MNLTSLRLAGICFAFATLVPGSRVVSQRSLPAQAAPVAAHRESRSGWIYVRVGGSPHEVGYQYGSLLAPEIDDALKTLKASLVHETHREWSFYRDAAQRLFWPRLDAEYQQELAGIAEGLKARGYSYDTEDLLAENGYIELSGYYLPSLESKAAHRLVSGARLACSAFAATGAYTADHKVVIGQNFWWDILLGQRFRVALDVTPAHGNRFVLDTLPGFIHSGTDWAINSAGIVVTETTISGFHGFDEHGVPEFMRMRKAVQYANSLDDFVRIMSEGNNGGYANTWLLADTRTNEIGKLELGLRNVAFSRSKDGYYIGANYPEDANLTAQECVPGVTGAPSLVGRKQRWQTLMAHNKGKIDVAMARLFLADTYDELHKTEGPNDCSLCGRGEGGGAVNAKATTSDMARNLQFWARENFPDGVAFKAGDLLDHNSSFAWMKPYLRDMPAEPWVILPPGS